MNEALLLAIEHGLGVDHSAVTVAVRKSLDYQSNTLYDIHYDKRHIIGKYFLKLEEQSLAPAREYDALQRLVPYDIAPKPLFYDPAIGPVVLYEYLPGTMWDRTKPSAQQLDKLAQLWLQLHSLPTDGLWLSKGWEQRTAEVQATFQQRFDKYGAWAERHFPAGQQALTLCRQALEQSKAVFVALSKLSPPLAFCRADPRFANVIERPDGRLAYVDWEDSGLRDPARDLADLLTHPNQEDLLTYDEWQPFLHPYHRERLPVDRAVEERMHQYMMLFPLFWLQVCMRIGVNLAATGQLAGWQINGLPANVRMRRYLARALAWPALTFEENDAALADLQFFPIAKEL